MSDNHKSLNDHRLYVPSPESWTAHVKSNSMKEYCYQKNPGEDHFHLLVKGEVFLANNDQKLCLNCALRQELLTTDRMHWKRS